MESTLCSLIIGSIFSADHHYRFTKLRYHQKQLFIHIKTTTKSVPCIHCNTISTHVHSHYQRKILDLPIFWFTVYLMVRVQRYFCKNPACSQKIFTESISNIAGRYGRMTNRLQSTIIKTGFELGGESALRILRLFNIPISADTILRAITKIALKLPQKVKILGIDDWAMKRGERYGTVLVDLEKRSVIDLLPDRTAETLAEWLHNHNEIEVISRDRALAYIKGSKEGAPQAIQVADRWHLLKNFSEIFERLIKRKFAKIRTVYESFFNDLFTEESQIKDKKKNANQKLPKHQEIANNNYNRKKEVYNQIKKLYQQGVNKANIARILGIGRSTVIRYLKYEQFPAKCSRAPRTSIVDPFKEYIHHQWNVGVTNAAQIFSEIKQQSYSGSPQHIRRYVQKLRTNGNTNRKIDHDWYKIKKIVSSPKKWIHLLLFDKSVNDKTEKIRDLVFKNLPVIEHATALGKKWKQILMENKTDELEQWMLDVESLGDDFKTYITSLRQDLSAVENASRFSWSNGQVEGQVNRIKAIKRQMYGRASFQLLRKRILYQSDRLDLVG